MIRRYLQRATAFGALLLLSGPVFAQDAAAPAAGGAGQGRGGGADPSDDAMRMGSPPKLQQGLTEEAMWPAATAEGWAKPCLIPWQRSFQDAVQLSKATDRPILVAVNMDGEIASEHYAGVRYRDAQSARFFEPYVCVIASVYRHTPRDYDEQGQRVLCPRFGSVTCGEHIAAETVLYEMFFEDRRIAPRHIALDLEGKEMYDVYFAWDTDTIFTALRKGAEDLPPPRPFLLDDAPVEQRTQSPDIHQRKMIQ
jgi:hypothetical protein